jgi:hypothetical protein
MRSGDAETAEGFESVQSLAGPWRIRMDTQGAGIPEANAELACTWFPDIGAHPTVERRVGVCTPVGWKDHILRFNVRNDGSIGPNTGTQALDYSAGTNPEHDGRRLWIEPSRDGAFSCEPPPCADRQGWHEGPAPVLWTEWEREGCRFRSDVMAHQQGGQAAVTGREPLFAWVRLSLRGAPREAGLGFALGARFVGTSENVSARDLPAEGWQLADERGRVVLGIPGGQQARLLFRHEPEQGRFRIFVQPTGPGGTVDLLMPAAPVDAAVYADEVAPGRDRALAETQTFWSETAAGSAAVVDTPEPFVNRALAQSIKFVEMMTTRDPATGLPIMLSGAIWYHATYAAPDCLRRVWLLEQLGQFEMSEKYLRIYQQEQGTRSPYGDRYPQHSGYLADPIYASTTAPWITSHGAILYNIAAHALLRGAPAFVQRYLATVIRACEFIRDSRAFRHDGLPGLLPPARSTDFDPGVQDAFSNGLNYKGLVTAARLLRRIGHPRSEEFAREAEAYRTAIVAALRAATASLPSWTDADGREQPTVPNIFYPEAKRQDRFLDTAAHLLVFAEVLPADDPLMQASVAMYRAGGPGGTYRPHSCANLYDHEVCVSEPCYSWNLFSSHALGDRARFLEGLYGMLACGVSRDTHISSEGQICGWINDNLFTISTVAHMVRLCVVDDQYRPDELHLLRLVPLAWLTPGARCRFEKIPTEFGPATLLTAMSADGKTLDVTYKPSFRFPPKKAVLHAPPVPGLKWIRINGERQPAKGAIALLAP